MVWEITINSTKIGTLNKLEQELNGKELAVIDLPNTSDNLTLVGTDKDVTIKWDGTSIFLGKLKGSDYKEDNLGAKVYDRVYEKLNAKDFTGEYTTTSADTILGAICTAAGVTKGSCPATLLSVKFVKANCFDAAVFIAASCNKDYWSTLGTTFNIGDRGSDKGTVSPIAAPKRSTDRATQRNHVWIKGASATGTTIWGEAKSVGWTPETDRPITFNERKATDIATLNNIAAYKLTLLEKESSGVSIPLKLEVGMTIYPGDTVTINRTDLNLSGSYRVWKTSKTVKSVTLEIDRPDALAESYILEQQTLEDLGIYPVPTVSPDLNLLLNPSFEQDSDGDGIPDYWAFIQYTGTPAGSRVAGGFEGQYCVQSSNSPSQRGDWITPGFLAVEEGRVYLVRARYKKLSGTLQQMVLYIHWYTEAKVFITTSAVAKTDMDATWRENVVKGTAPSTARYARVGLATQTIAGQTGIGQWDSVWMFKQLSWEEIFDEGVSAPLSKQFLSGTFRNIVAPCTIVSDSSAKGGQCLKIPGGSGNIMEPFDGPTTITGVLAGEYYSLYAVKVSNKSSTSIIGRLRVAGNAAELAGFDLKPSLFSAANTWEVFAIRVALKITDTAVYQDIYNFIDLGVDLYVNWLGFVPASIPLAYVEISNQSLGIPSDDFKTLHVQDLSLGIPSDDDKTLHVADLSLGIPNDDLSELTFTAIADSGVSGESTITAGPGYSPGGSGIVYVTVNASGYSAPMIIEVIVERQSGVSDFARLQFLLSEVAQLNPRHNFATMISDQSPNHRGLIPFYFKYGVATVLCLYARAQAAESCRLHGRIIVWAKNKHQHTITEQTPYRGQNDLDVVTHQHTITEQTPYRGQNDLDVETHQHTITEQTPYRGVDKTDGWGTKQHKH